MRSIGSDGRRDTYDAAMSPTTTTADSCVGGSRFSAQRLEQLDGNGLDEWSSTYLLLTCVTRSEEALYSTLLRMNPEVPPVVSSPLLTCARPQSATHVRASVGRSPIMPVIATTRKS